MKKPSALILDRDGTLVAMVLNQKGEQDSPYFARQIELYPDIHALLEPFERAGIPLFLATNQPGIAKGWFSRADLEECHSAVVTKLRYPGFRRENIYACLHHPTGMPGGDKTFIMNCDCRKPKPGLLIDIQNQNGIDLARAIYIGDSQVDVEAGCAAKVGEIFLVKSFISETVPVQKRRYQTPDGQPLVNALRKAALTLVPIH